MAQTSLAGIDNEAEIMRNVLTCITTAALAAKMLANVVSSQRSLSEKQRDL